MSITSDNEFLGWRFWHSLDVASYTTCAAQVCPSLETNLCLPSRLYVHWSTRRIPVKIYMITPYQLMWWAAYFEDSILPGAISQAVFSSYYVVRIAFNRHSSLLKRYNNRIFCSKFEISFEFSKYSAWNSFLLRRLSSAHFIGKWEARRSRFSFQRIQINIC